VLTSAEKIRYVQDAIARAERALRFRWPVLRYQNAIGLALWVVGFALVIATAALYLERLFPAWVTVIAIALAVSVLHELEHDLIHNLYFKSRAWVQHAMFTGIWLVKMSLNPWTRREIHLRHHRVSGQEDDIEERLIGLGEKRVWLRVLTSFLPLMAVLVYLPPALRSAPDWKPFRADWFRLWRWRQRLDVLFAIAPVVLAVLAVQGAGWATDVLVVLVLPNLLRHGCLALLSSYGHYYGDIPEHDVTMQNQILRHPLLWPLQLFCWNFGATHIIHHYYTPQPFFIRPLIRREAWRALEAVGTRVNDFGVIARANRYGQR